MRALSLDDGV
jgi:hypothetical protein